YPPSPFWRNGLMFSVQDREVDRLVRARGEMDIPVAFECLDEVEMLDPEAGGPGNIAGHDHRVVAVRLHGLPFFSLLRSEEHTSYEITYRLNVCKKLHPAARIANGPKQPGPH